MSDKIPIDEIQNEKQKNEKDISPFLFSMPFNVIDVIPKIPTALYRCRVD